jgi:anti-sigma regulatory factor (Ser/Thr protein kinase)
MTAELIAWPLHEGTYRSDPAQVGFVRSAVRELLAGCPRADDAILVASELAANAVVHSSGDRFAVRCEVHPDHVYLMTEDRGRWVPPQPHEDGRPHGLDLVNALVGPGNWSILTSPGGHTRAWARLQF